MKRTNRVLVLVVVVSLAVIAGSAMAQQMSAGRVQPEQIVALAAQEAVQKDLGVSGDVARKLMSLLRVDCYKAEQKALEDAGITSIQDRMRMMTRERPKYVEIMKKVNDEFIPKLKELLTAEQYQRFQQIHFQNRFNINGPRTLLEPEVASELKLTDDQKKELDTLNGEFRRSGPYSAAFRGIPGTLSPENTKKHGEEYRTKAIELLTAEQKEALNKLEGNEFDLSGLVFRSTLPPPRNGNVAAGPAIAQQKSEGTRDVGTLQSPNIVNMAAVEAVQKDLGVSDEVASKLTLLRDEYRAAAQKEYQDAGINPRDFPNSLTAEQQRKYIEIGRRLNNEFFPKAKELLTANQNKRFQQIQFQSRLRGLSAMALLAPEVASELNLTDDQKRKLNALRNEFIPKQNALMTVVGGKKGSGDREGLAKLREEYATKAMEVLTAEQRETMNKLKGNEFDLSKFVPPGTRQDKGN